MTTKKSIVIMASLCLNFCYGQEMQNCPKPSKSTQQNKAAVNQPYKYDISGFKSGYKPGYRISNDEFMKGKSITVRNYTITQLFALALQLRAANYASKKIRDTSREQQGNRIKDASDGQTGIDNQIVVDVREPEKLEAVHCFQLVVPFYLTDNFYVIMQQCLNAEFPDYIVQMENRGGLIGMVIKDKVY